MLDHPPLLALMSWHTHTLFLHSRAG